MKPSVIIILIISIFLSANLAPADTGNIECVTDKSEYTLDESLQIIITNNSSSNIHIVNRSEIDGGFATIQIKQANQSWNTIPIIAAANITIFEILKPKESYTYWWHIRGKSLEEILIVPGIYRIMLNIGVQTNEFKIN